MYIPTPDGRSGEDEREINEIKESLSALTRNEKIRFLKEKLNWNGSREHQMFLTKQTKLWVEEEISRLESESYEEWEEKTKGRRLVDSALYFPYSEEENRMADEIELKMTSFNTTQQMREYLETQKSVQANEVIFDFICKKLEALAPNSPLEQTTEQPIKELEKQSLNEIALTFHFEGNQITRENAKEIALKHGWTSGEALFQRFTKWSSRTNRISPEASKRKNENKLKLFEKVIGNLADNATTQKKAIEERDTLKAVIEKEE